jgi:hypothetical protein
MVDRRLLPDLLQAEQMIIKRSASQARFRRTEPTTSGTFF